MLQGLSWPLAIGAGHTAAAGGLNPATYSGTLITIPLKQHELDALVSFHFNTGAIGRASFVKRLNAGDRAGAMVGMMDWRKPPEILPRRTAERDLFQTGI